MNQTTAGKIRNHKEQIWKIHQNRSSYAFTIPMLDEPYQLALEILEYEGQDPYEIANKIGINWQTVKQVLKTLE